MKKKKLFFIISSSIIILLSLYTIIFSRQIVEKQLEALNMLSNVFPQDMLERMTTLYEKGGPILFIVTSAISLISSIIILILCIKNKLDTKRSILISCYIAIFLTGVNTITTLLAIIGLIFCLTIKENKEEKIKREIPKLEKINLSTKDILLAILLLVIYFSQIFWSPMLPQSLTSNQRLMISISFDLILAIICVFVFNKRLKRDFKALKDNFKAYIGYIFPRLGIMYIIFVIVSLISMLITKEAVSQNQATLEALPLYYTMPLAIIWAPLVEEILFRGCFRRFFKNNILFIIISALVFGLLHTVNEANILLAFIHSLPYCVLGGFFAYIYTKTDNISSNMLCHFFQNTIAMLLSLLLIK